MGRRHDQPKRTWLQAAAAEEHVAMPMAAQALTLYRLLVASGHSERDAGAVVALYPRRDPPGG